MATVSQLDTGRHPVRRLWQDIVKRAIDVLLGTLLLILLAPLMGFIAVLIWVMEGRPILYTWRVVGKGGMPFQSWKFRTMVRDADRHKHELLSRNEMVGPVFKIRDDPRLTSSGRFLRRYSLDELPQLFSVILGDMSLVGPRPPLLDEWERFQPWQRRKLAVIPGLTCIWQVQGRADIRDFNDWVRMDLEYIDHWSLLLDLKILAQTAIAVLARKGAY